MHTRRTVLRAGIGAALVAALPAFPQLGNAPTVAAAPDVASDDGLSDDELLAELLTRMQAAPVEKVATALTELDMPVVAKAYLSTQGVDFYWMQSRTPE